ncbi:hypothetical protein [Ensifer canadensis]
MAQLHVYEKLGNIWVKVASGNGTASTDKPFTITLSSGSVTSGRTYDFRHGELMTGELCHCTAIVGRTATLRAVTVEEAATLDWRSKVVTIIVDLEDLVSLKANNYAMCFAKKVALGSDGGSYNVVWQSLTGYSHSTSFLWWPQFALFATNYFVDGRMVVASTNEPTLEFGQRCVLNQYGLLEHPVSFGPDGVTMENQYGPIHPALSQASVLNGVQTMTPIYVAPDLMSQGSVTLNPINTVMVWFQQDISCSTMFSSARSMSIEIDLSMTNTVTCLYKGGKWSAPS